MFSVEFEFVYTLSGSVERIWIRLGKTIKLQNRHVIIVPN